MINGITPKSKIRVHWKVSPYDYNIEKVNSLIQKVSKKYGCPKDNIRIIPEFKLINENGDSITLSDSVVKDIQNPIFQQKLFIEYLNLNGIKDFDFDILKDIDNSINSRIDYEIYDKYRNYSIKWVKWSNFLSYGRDNFFDFSSLNSIVLLSGEPANQSGKTTFAIDLLHFLLFGKTAKAATQDKIFNKFLDDETEVVVEGCLNIEGEDYVIKRTLSRPVKSKRTSKSKTTQKVKYYKVVGETLEELEDYVENFEGESSVHTNKIIKESIGKEDDFDMIICATSSNLDDLIEKKETERGRLLARWIGLLPIEQKDAIAREKFNGEIKPYLLLNKYNVAQLEDEIKTNAANVDENEKENEKYGIELNSLSERITLLESTKETLNSTRIKVDESILQIDKTTLFSNIESVKEQGIQKKRELDAINEEINGLGEITFEVLQFDEATKEIANLEKEIALIRMQCQQTKKEIDSLEKSEYCPMCGRKYDNIDNSEKIKDLKNQYNKLIESGKQMHMVLINKTSELESLKELRAKFDKKSKLTLKANTLKYDILSLREKFKDLDNKRKEYEKNNEAIDKNNELDLKIRNLEVELKGLRTTKENTLVYIERVKNRVASLRQEIENNLKMIDKLKEEETIVRHWKIYLEMVGKNGISKMVLRKTLPIINAQMAHILADVCDFDVEISINDKNDIQFYLVKDGVYSDISSGSGFEKTTAALVLRVVLGTISSLPKLDGIILDELWGRVAKENLDNMHKVLEKILGNYKYIIQISHLDEVKDWSQQHIVVKKDKNISYLEMKS